MKDYYVYIMTNQSGTLYVGVTSNLMRRVQEHKTGMNEGFTKQNKLNRPAYFETGNDIEGAITREKQIKGWLRKKKIALIAEQNPKWLDLSDGWYEAVPAMLENQVLHSAQNDKVERPSLIHWQPAASVRNVSYV